MPLSHPGLILKFGCDYRYLILRSSGHREFQSSYQTSASVVSVRCLLFARGQSGCYFAVAGHGIARVHNREDRQLVKASYNKASIPHAKNVDGVQADTTDIRTLIKH